MSTHESTRSPAVPAVGVLAAPDPRRVSSLAYTDHMVTTKPAVTCEKSSGRVVMDLISGQVWPDTCRTLTCDVCLPRLARRRALAITLAAPQRMIRLSLVAATDSDHPCRTALIRIKRIRQALQRMRLAPGEWTYTIERNPKGTGYHAHCLQIGSSINQDQLQIACERAKAGIPFINSIKRKGQWTSRYGLKGFGADGYGLKKFRSEGDSADALRMNNGVLEHHTTGFYQWEGEVLRVRDYERLAISAMNQDKPIALVGMHPSQVDRILNDAGLRHKMTLDVYRRSAAKLRAVA